PRPRLRGQVDGRAARPRRQRRHRTGLHGPRRPPRRTAGGQRLQLELLSREPRSRTKSKDRRGRTPSPPGRNNRPLRASAASSPIHRGRRIRTLSTSPPVRWASARPPRSGPHCPTATSVTASPRHLGPGASAPCSAMRRWTREPCGRRSSIPEVRTLGEIVWFVDLNRQPRARGTPDVQIKRLQGMFEAAGWQVLTCPWRRRLEAVFAAPGGRALEDRLVKMTNPEYRRLLRAHPSEVHDRLLAGLSEAEA